MNLMLLPQDECTYEQYQRSLRGDAMDVMTMAERDKADEVCNVTDLSLFLYLFNMFS